MRALVLVLLALGVTGCAVSPPEPEAGGERMPVAAWEPPAAPTDWRLRGRAAVKVPDESGTLSVDWRQQGRTYRLDLRGTLGAGAVRLEGGSERTVLTRSDGERLTADSARTLLREATGFDLPVSRLAWWVRGQPVPRLGGTVVLDAQGRPVELVQDGWRVRYDRWTKVNGFRLPGRLSVKRDGVRLRLAVARWEAKP